MKTIIIAEAGVNHNGSLENAKKLIEIAAEAGADFVKFQTFKAEKLVSRNAEKAEYQKKSGNESQFEMLQKLELSEADHFELLEHCKRNNIAFLSTAFDVESIDFLKSLGIETGKIPSGEITNLPYLRKMAQSFEKIVLSTGMSTITEIGDAIEVLYQNGTIKENLTVLHCNTEYPTPMHDVNLLAMHSLRDNFGINIGYSDHTMGIEVPTAAVALGASLIEKHFTISRNWEGPDHGASLEPSELKAMVSAIRNIEKALGKAEKRITDSEKKNKYVARKSIVATANIKEGEIFNVNNIGVKRPGNGISPMRWDTIIGLTAKKAFSPDELIEI